MNACIAECCSSIFNGTFTAKQFLLVEATPTGCKSEEVENYSMDYVCKKYGRDCQSA